MILYERRFTSARARTKKTSSDVNGKRHRQRWTGPAEGDPERATSATVALTYIPARVYIILYCTRVESSSYNVHFRRLSK